MRITKENHCIIVTAVLTWASAIFCPVPSCAFQLSSLPPENHMGKSYAQSSAPRLDTVHFGRKQGEQIQPQSIATGGGSNRLRQVALAARSSSSSGNQKSPGLGRRGINGEEDSTERRGIGGVRGIFRRIRGGGKKDEDDNEKSKRKGKPDKTIAKKTTRSPSAKISAGSTIAIKTQRSKTRSMIEDEAELAKSSWTNFFRGNRTATDVEEPSKKKQKSSSFPSVVQKLAQRIADSSGDGGGEKWVTVFPKTRISPGEMVPVTVDGIDLLVVASNDGKKRLYCIENSCPHLGTPLELGTLVRLPRVDEDGSTDDESDAQSIEQQTAESSSAWTELQVSSILQQDGCEDCIVCPLHKTAFALESGQPRGEWCPYPPVVGKMVGTIKRPTAAPIFGVRVRGKDVQVRMNTPIVSDKKQ